MKPVEYKEYEIQVKKMKMLEDSLIYQKRRINHIEKKVFTPEELKEWRKEMKELEEKRKK